MQSKNQQYAKQNQQNHKSISELHKNVCFHVDRLMTGRATSYINAFKNTAKVVAFEFNQHINPDKDIFEILEDENIIEHVKSFKKHIGSTNKSKSAKAVRRMALNFILDEVIAFRGTKHWLSYESNNDFDEKLNALERYSFCVARAIEIIQLSYPKISYFKASTYLVSKINELSGGKYFSINTIKFNNHKTGMPLWVEHDPSKEPRYYFTRMIKPTFCAKVIETLAQAPSGYLVDELSISKNPSSQRGLKESKRNINEDFDISLINKTFREELKLYAEYKTNAIHETNRNDKWKVRKQENKSFQKYKTIMDAELIVELSILKSDQYIPSFRIFTTQIIFICRHALKYNLLKPEELSLYRVCQVEILEEIFNQIITKTQSVGYAARILVSFLSAIWHPNSCFFVQYADLFCDRYGVSKDQLIEQGKKNHERFNKLKKNILPYIKQSETSHNFFNEKVLKLESPINYVFNILSNAKLELASHLSRKKDITYRVACLIREICLVSCLLNCPLRVRNWSNMKLGYHAHDECIFWDEVRGCYVLSVPKSQFKNFKQKNIPATFQIDFQPQFTEVIKDYIENARPVILKGATSNSFLVTQHGDHIRVGVINTFVKKFTEKYDDKNLRIGGINIHGFRAIVATTFLKKFKGSFAYAAFLLLDSEETIREHYGHLSPNDAFMEWGKIITTDEGLSA